MDATKTAKQPAGFNLHSWAMAGVLLGLWALLALLPATNDVFLTRRNLAILTLQISPIVVIAVGMTLVIVTRGIDLSVGAMVALTGVVAAILQIDYGMPAWLAIAAALGAGALLGIWQGFWVAYCNVPAFVVTLAGFNAFRGLALVMSDSRGLSPMGEDFAIVADNIPPSVTMILLAIGLVVGVALVFRDASRRRRFDIAPVARAVVASRCVAIAALSGFLLIIYADRGMPVLVSLAAVAVLVGVFIAKKTRFGRHVYAIGGNPEAARLAGINVRRTLLGVYAFIGVLAALAGVMLAARTNGVTPGNAGSLWELDVITAVVIGGTSLSGGRGSIVGSLLGAMVFGTLANGMNLLQVNSNWQLILKGMILMAAVLADVLSKRKRS